MQVGRPADVRSGINVTPLVDVVLVLLIVFMVMAPQLQTGPPVQLPRTDEPRDQPERGQPIVVVLEPGGIAWVDDERVAATQIASGLGRRAATRAGREVVIKGDARLAFGEVRQAMEALERAGFGNVSLITERRARPAAGS